MNFKALFLTIASSLLLSANALALENTQNDAQKKMVITISDSNINSAGFGLAVANAMQDAGIQSTVFIAANAVDYALVNTDQGKFAGLMPKDMIVALIKKGGKVMICEGFVKLKKINKTDIVNGVGIATPNDLAGAMYAQNAKSMTF